MGSPPARPVPQDDLGLVERLVQNRLCGEVATPVGSCLHNCRRLVAGDAGYTFGLSDWRQASFDDAVAAVEAAGGRRLRGHADEDPAFIDPGSTLAGVRRHRQALAELVAAGGGRVLMATGHPVLLPHYGSVARALAGSGCLILTPLDDGRQFGRTPEGSLCSMAYVDGVAALLHDGEARHTHLPDYMTAMLDHLGDALPDLVVADHGFAGAAIEAGIATLAIADVNDPALPLAQARGRTEGVLLIDDGLRADLFAPVTEAVIAWGSPRGGLALPSATLAPALPAVVEPDELRHAASSKRQESTNVPEGAHAMRSLVVSTFLTLDGVMQAPGGPEEDPTGGFAHGGWSVNYWDEAMGAAMTESFDTPFDLLLGRKTYEIFAAHWPHVSDEERAERGGTASDVDDPAGAALNSARKYVASRTLDKVEWQNSTLLQGDLAEAVAELKAQDGPDLMVQGSSDLIQTLLEHDLVDELRIWTFPVVVGPGKRLFGEGTVPAGLQLVDCKTSTTGVIMATYKRAGEIDHGSFAFENPTDQEIARRERLAEDGR